MVRRLAPLFAIALLAACGQSAPLRPEKGQPLPVKPLMAKTTPTAEDLLRPPAYARPQRVDELIRRSQPRRVDRFDLPPPGGAAAPPLVGTEPESSTNQTGPTDPE